MFQLLDRQTNKQTWRTKVLLKCFEKNESYFFLFSRSLLENTNSVCNATQLQYILVYKSRNFGQKIQPKFYQFDLFAGHKKYLPKCTKTISCVFQSLLFTKIKHWNFRILDTFCHFFSIWLIRRSTYTRVYTVTLLTF